MKSVFFSVSLVCAVLLLPSVAVAQTGQLRTPPPYPGKPFGIKEIQYVIIIMQENRSFDTYFGTYPGADRHSHAKWTTLSVHPDPKGGNCQMPYLNHNDKNGGGPHGAKNAAADVDGGKMDGFIGQAEKGTKGCTNPDDPSCTNGAVPDVMGYHDGSDIPNYWAYAQNFVLHDHMFEPNASWSLPMHLFLVSEWSALCTQHNDPASCTNALQSPGLPPDFQKSPTKTDPIYAWTDLTYLLHKYNVSWGYYVVEGTESGCEDDEQVNCPAITQNPKTPGSGIRCPISIP